MYPIFNLHNEYCFYICSFLVSFLIFILIFYIFSFPLKTTLNVTCRHGLHLDENMMEPSPMSFKERKYTRAKSPIRTSNRNWKHHWKDQNIFSLTVKFIPTTHFSIFIYCSGVFVLALRENELYIEKKTNQTNAHLQPSGTQNSIILAETCMQCRRSQVRASPHRETTSWQAGFIHKVITRV